MITTDKYKVGDFIKFTYKKGKGILILRVIGLKDDINLIFPDV